MREVKKTGPDLMRENGKKLVGFWVEDYDLAVIDGLAAAAGVKRGAYIRGLLLAVHSAGLTLAEVKRMGGGRYHVL